MFIVMKITKERSEAKAASTHCSIYHREIRIVDRKRERRVKSFEVSHNLIPPNPLYSSP